MNAQGVVTEEELAAAREAGARIARGEGPVAPRPRRYRGVKSLRSGKFGAVIRDPVGRRRMWLGTFPSAEAAAHAYDGAARELHGPRARPNFRHGAPPAAVEAVLAAELRRRVGTARSRVLAPPPPADPAPPQPAPEEEAPPAPADSFSFVPITEPPPPPVPAYPFLYATRPARARIIRQPPANPPPPPPEAPESSFRFVPLANPFPPPPEAPESSLRFLPPANPPPPPPPEAPESSLRFVRSIPPSPFSMDGPSMFKPVNLTGPVPPVFMTPTEATPPVTEGTPACTCYSSTKPQEGSPTSRQLAAALLRSLYNQLLHGLAASSSSADQSVTDDNFTNAPSPWSSRGAWTMPFNFGPQ